MVYRAVAVAVLLIAAVSLVAQESDLRKYEDQNCSVIMARTQDDVTAAREFCDGFNPGLFVGVIADESLLYLWVKESLARDLLADRLQAKQAMLNLMKIWKNLSDSLSVLVKIYWGDVLIMTGDTTVMRGDVVTFE